VAENLREAAEVATLIDMGVKSTMDDDGKIEKTKQTTKESEIDKANKMQKGT